MNDTNSTSEAPEHAVRKSSLWGAGLGCFVAILVTVVGLTQGKGMSLVSVSLFTAAMTVWTYRDVRDRDISRAAWAEYVVNILIVCVYGVVSLGLDNDTVANIIDAFAAAFLVVFVARRAVGERRQLEASRISATFPVGTDASRVRTQQSVGATAVAGGLVIAIFLWWLRRRREI